MQQPEQPDVEGHHGEQAEQKADARPQILHKAQRGIAHPPRRRPEQQQRRRRDEARGHEQQADRHIRSETAPVADPQIIV